MAHGRYTVVRKLAEGGMAEIFLARQHGSEGFQKPVVLKRIHSGFVADDQFRHMLVDEGHISMGLLHNNIVQVLDLGRARGRMFLALELVDGWDLSRILHRASQLKTWLPPGLGVYIITEVTRALSYAHGRTKPDGSPMGIVHRDISPQNILISEQGEVKLADFGIAKAMNKRDRTATGVVKGKVAFMSPEQALGQEIDARSDLFALGTMLYLLMTGVRPFEAPTDFEIIARVQKCVFTPAEEVRPDMPPALAALIRRAMAHERDERYQSADELLVDLEGVARSVFHSPGQTELKLWLAELGRRDGVPPIGRAAAMATGDGEHKTDLGEGDALVLGDERSDRGVGAGVGELEPDESMNGVEAVDPVEELGLDERRNRATSNIKTPSRRGAPRARVTGVEPTLGRRLASAEPADVSLAVDEGERGDRTRRRGRAFSLGFLLVLAAGGGGGYMLWRSQMAAPEDPAAAAPATPPPAAAQPAVHPLPDAGSGERRRSRERERLEKGERPDKVEGGEKPEKVEKVDYLRHLQELTKGVPKEPPPDPAPLGTPPPAGEPTPAPGNSEPPKPEKTEKTEEPAPAPPPAPTDPAPAPAPTAP